MKKGLHVSGSLSDLPANKIPRENMSDFQRSLRKTCLTENGFRIKFPHFSSVLKARIFGSVPSLREIKSNVIVDTFNPNSDRSSCKAAQADSQARWVPGSANAALEPGRPSAASAEGRGSLL